MALATSAGLQFSALLLQQDTIAAAELRSYLASLAKNPGQTSVHLSANPGVFSSVIPSISKLKSSAGCLLFDLCTALPRKLIADIAVEEIWSMGKIDATNSGDVASYRVADDSALPQQYFTQVTNSMSHSITLNKIFLY